MDSSTKAQSVADHADRVLNLKNASLGDEYRYSSLPLCVIDAVYSIGVRYAGVTNVIARYCLSTKLRRLRDGADLPTVEKQQSMTEFCTHPQQRDPIGMANSIYRNTQRTSPRGGILKADAAFRFAKCLLDGGVEYFQDLSAIGHSIAFEKAIRSIPGQKSGISLQYFWMLAGNDDLIKPDRMVIRFLETALDRSVTVDEANILLKDACGILKRNYPNMTPRLLDHEVWKHQKVQSVKVCT